MTSWLKSLENVLEKVDSTAASLKKDTPTVNQPTEEPLYDTKTTNYTPKKNVITEEKPQLKDEDIFEFLNGPIQQAKEQKKLERKFKKQPEPTVKIEVDSIDNSSPTVNNDNIRPSQSQASSIANDNTEENIIEDVVNTNETSKEQTLLEDNNSVEQERGPKITNNKESIGTITESTYNEEEMEKLQDDNEQLALENKLLRNEVVSLNQEMVSLTSRSKHLQNELDRLNSSYQDIQKNSFEKDKLFAKLKRSEEELESTLITKSTKLEEVSRELKNKEDKINSLQDKLDKLTSDKESSYQINKDRLDQLEKSIKEEVASHNSSKQQFHNRERELESTISDLTKALAVTQRQLEDKISEIGKAQIQTKETQEAIKNIKQELNEYKIRAAKVLQEKEKTIKELSNRMSSNSDNNNPNNNNNNNNGTDVPLADFIQLQQECDTYKEETSQLKSELIALKSLLQETQFQLETDTDMFQSQIKENEESLEREQKRVQTLQTELVIKSQEFNSFKEDVEKKNEEIKLIIKIREEEILRLKKQITAKAFNHHNQEELETRLQALTEHLIQKQNQLEALTSEKAYLQLQVESLISQQQVLQGQLDKKLNEDKPNYVNIDISSTKKRYKNRSEDSHSRLKPMSSLVENNVVINRAIGRKVIGAANFLDSVSNETGWYLRHSPAARLGFIFYIFLLHLWVIYLFFSWNPEIHEVASGGKEPIQM